MKQRITTIGLSLLFVAGLAVYLRHQREMHAEAHTQMLQLRQSLIAGNTKADVERLFEPTRYPLLELRKLNEKEWVVMTPYEFGASNWYLYLEFEGVGLSEIRVRLEDSENIRPDLAPPDIRRK
jgi:hypothetical protein